MNIFLIFVAEDNADSQQHILSYCALQSLSKGQISCWVFLPEKQQNKM